MKKKVTFVITKANWGGAQRYVFDLATALQSDLFEVSVVFGQGGALANKLAETHIPTTQVSGLQRDISFVSDVRSAVALYTLFCTTKPDIVHLNSSKAAGVGALAARLAGVPRIVFTAHGWPFLESRSFVFRAGTYLLSWLTALLSHCVIVVSEHDLHIAKKMPGVGKKTVRIYNGINSHFTLELQSGQYVREQFPKGVHITGTIGELTPNKNQLALILRAAADPSMYVAICGEGESRHALQQAIEQNNVADRVKLFGFVDPRAVLKGFDTFALPSTKEGLPYVLLEAKAAGLPIVANRVGGVGEILDATDMQEFTLARMVENTKKVYLS